MEAEFNVFVNQRRFDSQLIPPGTNELLYLLFLHLSVTETDGSDINSCDRRRLSPRRTNPSFVLFPSLHSINLGKDIASSISGTRGKAKLWYWLAGSAPPPSSCSESGGGKYQSPKSGTLRREPKTGQTAPKNPPNVAHLRSPKDAPLYDSEIQKNTRTAGRGRTFTNKLQPLLLRNLFSLRSPIK